MEKRAFSKRQFAMSGFDATGYRFPDTEGVFNGTLVCKRWGKSNNLLAFFEFDCGDKIICAAWQNTEYMELPEIPMGARVTVRFEKTSGDKLYLRAIEKMDY